MKKFPFALGLGALLCLGACTGNQQPQTSSEPASLEEAKEEVHLVHTLLYLGIDLTGHHELLVVTGIDGGK
ncbi:MAG: hypothetical protein IKM80_03595, partial [Bacilli bacterium]|nr:hypothetical protein [Bacilli bacterium]